MSAIDAASFRRIYAEHVGLVQYVLHDCGIRDAEKDDLVQETFLRLHRAPGPMPPERIKGFLVLTARNLAIDTYRRKKSRRTDADPDAVGAAAEGLWESDARRTVLAQAAGELLDELAKEPGTEVLTMFYRQGLSVKEISAKTGQATGTVTARLSRLRARLGDRIRAYVAEVDTEGLR